MGNRFRRAPMMPSNPDRNVTHRGHGGAANAANPPRGAGMDAGATLAVPRRAKGRGVSRAVAVPLLWIAFSGCLVLQSVDPADTRPHTVPIIDLMNLPPYMLTPQVAVYLPTQADLAHSPPCKCILHFEIATIKEEDPTVDLEARWFVDYNLNGTATSQLSIARQTLTGAFNSNPFRGPVVFDFDPVLLGIAVDPVKEPNGQLHVIEMVIAEAQGFATDADPQVFPNRSLKPGWDGTTYKIVANVQNSAPGVTQCNRNASLTSPPLQRVPADSCN